MSKHTPKPWEIDGQTIYGSGKNPFICHWSGSIFDAYLIAAAPELLAAAEELIEHYGYHGNVIDVSKVAKLEQAIKKAKGEDINE